MKLVWTHPDPRNLKQAEQAAKDGRRLKKLLADAEQKAIQNKTKIQDFWKNLKSLTRMVQAWRSGAYREIPWKSLVSAIGALLYFVNPLDLLPDVILFGFVDDALVVGYVLSSIKTDIEAFTRWAEARQSASA